MSPPHATETPAPTSPTTEHKIAGAAGIVSAGVLTSRVLGFVREMAMAYFLGAGWVADAFYVAFRIPNMVRDLFAEGAMSAGFIPVFTPYLTLKSKEEARALACAVFTALCLLLAAVICAGMLFAPPWIRLIAPGFSDDPRQYQLAITLTRIMFPFLFFISLAALAMGILNSVGRFGPPAFSSSAFNVVSLMMFFAALQSDPIQAGFVAACGVVLGGAAQCLVQLPALHQAGFRLRLQRPIWPLHPGVLQMGRLILPTLLGLSVVQINLFVNTYLASTLASGSVSYLYYGMRLIHLPLGLFAVALATALLPTLSAQSAQGQMDPLRRTVSFALRFVFFITTPAMLGLMALRQPIVHLLFEHGAFDATATQGTADAVLYYAAGLWAFAGIRIMAPVFYALKDTRTPVKIACVAMLVNVILCLGLMAPLQLRGLALATALSAAVNFVGLLVFLRRRIGRVDGRQILRSSLRTLIAAMLSMSPALWVQTLPLWQAQGAGMIKALLLAATILTSAILYFAIHARLHSEEAHFLFTFIQSKLPQKFRLQ